MRPLNRRRKLGVTMILTAVILLVSFFLVEMRVVPVVRKAVKVQAVNLAEKAINIAVNEVLADEKVSYDDIAKITYNSSGEITAVTIDSVKINSLKSKMSLRISEKISEIDNEEIYISLGTLSGIEIFSGRGPSLKFYTSLSGNASTNFQSKFESAGINQTRHQIMLLVSSDIYVMSSRGSAGKVNVNTSFCAAETVIVGKVPSVYAGFGDKITQK